MSGAASAAAARWRQVLTPGHRISANGFFLPLWRYELGKRAPNYELAAALGKVLGVPAAYFYAARDEEADLLRLFHRLPADARRKLLQNLRAHGASD